MSRQSDAATEYSHAAGMLGYTYSLAGQLTDAEKSAELRRRTKEELLVKLDKWNWDKRFFEVLDPQLQAMLAPEELTKLKDAHPKRE